MGSILRVGYTEPASNDPESDDARGTFVIAPRCPRGLRGLVTGNV